MMAIEQRNLVNKLSPLPFSNKYQGVFSPAPKLENLQSPATPSTGDFTPKKLSF
jgi:hypothetical protein